jgi:trk system potassium uptake protein TrkA
MGERLARSLVSTKTLDFLELCDDFSIANISLTRAFANQSVEDINLRKRFHLNIIVIIRQKRAISEILPNFVLEEEDILVVGGTNDAIRKFEKANEA